MAALKQSLVAPPGAALEAHESGYPSEQGAPGGSCCPQGLQRDSIPAVFLRDTRLLWVHLSLAAPVHRAGYSRALGRTILRLMPATEAIKVHGGRLELSSCSPALFPSKAGPTATIASGAIGGGLGGAPDAAGGPSLRHRLRRQTASGRDTIVALRPPAGRDKAAPGFTGLGAGVEGPWHDAPMPLDPIGARGRTDML